MPRRRKIKLIIAYDGTAYHGWQIQPGLKTVQRTLCEAATALLRHPTHVQGASRTDAGVHARGQVGLIDTTAPIPVDQLLSSLNDRLPPDIVILQAQEVGLNFDVMRDVTRKAYRYTICTGGSVRAAIPPISTAPSCWHFPGSLAVEAMHAAAQHLVGSWDFRSFAARVEENQDPVRTVFRCDVTAGIEGQRARIAIDIEANGFLHHMARIMAGTLIGVGRGHWHPEQMIDIREARDRAAAGHLAPAEGLSLEWIKFRQEDG